MAALEAMGPSAGAPALDRTRALLRPQHRDAPVAPGGYLDLLGEQSPPSTGRAQDLMLTRALPVVYERAWRPAWGRVLLGLTGGGMADERRIARLLLGILPGDRVLDLACGPGNFTRDFARAAGSDGLVVGLDASPTMLTRAVRDTDGEVAEGAPGTAPVAFARGDAGRLPFADGSFDAACCFAALHLFPDPEAALDELARVLAPGGRIAILTSCRFRSAPLRAVESLAGRLSGMRLFEPDEITDALAARGFTDVRRRVAGVAQYVGARFA
jgi:SAM-dependent methyltransferase